MSIPQADSDYERTVLDSLAPNLEADGFRVVIHPKSDTLPAFLRKYRPDMVAYKKEKKVAFEIKPRASVAHDYESNLLEIFAEHPDWELRFIYAPPISPDADIPVVPKQVVTDHLNRLEASLDVMGSTGALLTGWAIFEAAARTLLPSSLRRPQPSARLLEILASEGYVTPDESDSLRRLSQMRNGLAHGRLDISPSQDDITFLVELTRSLLNAPG